MQRTPINPWTWSAGLGYHQGLVVEAAQRTLYCAGQTATDANGQPRHPGDAAAQLGIALDNLEAVLAEAGMALADVVRLTVYTTQPEQTLANYGVLASRLGAAGAAPPTTLLGVSALALPELVVELEATAAA